MITYVEKGVPTETFEITDEASSPEKMIEDLNNLVALANERYEYHEDPLTKKKYIVKMEKPHFKCDISVLGGRTEAQLEAEVMCTYIRGPERIHRFRLHPGSSLRVYRENEER